MNDEMKAAIKSAYVPHDDRGNIRQLTAKHACMQPHAAPRERASKARMAIAPAAMTIEASLRDAISGKSPWRMLQCRAMMNTPKADMHRIIDIEIY